MRIVSDCPASCKHVLCFPKILTANIWQLVSWILALTAIVISRAKGSTFHSGPVGIRSSWVLSIWDGYMAGFATGSVLQLLNTSPDWNNQEMNHVQGLYGDLWLKLSEFNIYQVGGRYFLQKYPPKPSDDKALPVLIVLCRILHPIWKLGECRDVTRQVSRGSCNCNSLSLWLLNLAMMLPKIKND